MTSALCSVGITSQRMEIRLSLFTVNLHYAATYISVSWKPQSSNTHLFIKTMTVPRSPSSLCVTFTP